MISQIRMVAMSGIFILLFLYHSAIGWCQNTYTPSRPSHGSALGANAQNIQQQVHKVSHHSVPRQIEDELNSASTGSSIPGKKASSVQQVKVILNELRAADDRISRQLSIPKNAYAIHFESAYRELVEMLEGKRTLDLKRAVFLTENAFFDSRLSYTDYTASIERMVQFMQRYMQTNHLPADNKDAINYLAFKFMSDTLEIHDLYEGKTRKSYPKTYDFDDPLGYERPNHLFVTKLLSQNSGQCKSLPLLFLILVEALGGEAYLSFSPSHSYIKCTSEKGIDYNLELTNGMLTSDSWVVASGYVKAEAVRSGIYLDTLNKQKVIANCLVDLGQYYTYRFGHFDEFVLKCANKALEFHETNIQAIQLKSDYYTVKMQATAQKLGLRNPAEFKQHQESAQLFEKLQKMYALLDHLGFKNMSEEVYKEWMETLHTKKMEQESQVRLTQLNNY